MTRFTNWLGRTFIPGVAQDQAPAEPTPEWVHPYPEDPVRSHAHPGDEFAAEYAKGVLDGRERERAAAHQRGIEYRREWSTEPTVAAKAEAGVEGRVTPGSRPLIGGGDL